MKPATQNIEIYKGDTFQLFFRIRNRLPNGDPGDYVNLTGQTPKAQIRATEATASVLAEFTATLGDQTTFPGSVLLELSAATTTSLASGGVWDVQLTNGSGQVRTYLKGQVTLLPEVTR